MDDPQDEIVRDSHIKRRQDTKKLKLFEEIRGIFPQICSYIRYYHGREGCPDTLKAVNKIEKELAKL